MRQYDDLLIDALLDYGFTLDEAQRLIELQARVEYERQRARQRQQLAEWLQYLGGSQALN